MIRFPARTLLLLSLSAGLAACGNLPTRSSGEPGVRVESAGSNGSNASRYSMAQDVAPSRNEIPANVADTPDAVPVPLPRSASGNPQTYQVLGKTYEVLDDAHGFHQRGYASWYGKKFHGHKTASGERYDMFAMTAAHKRLPLPTFVRVTDLDNGKAVIVKVNDRGPFHSSRIIDLSYAAAAKLGMLAKGTAHVQIDAIVPVEDQPVVEPAAPAVATASMSATPVAAKPGKATDPDPRTLISGGYLQVAAYLDPLNATALQEQLQSQGVSSVSIRTRDGEDPPLHHVIVGPFADRDAAGPISAQLSALGLKSLWVGN
ncbi:MAG TPA: septal ring lytic transglycosylase RlpA family protein [Stenotrophobium sp.]|nr:septal ring lytic transglycosylase RlpA family protein [Stenotrophobium sp.]